jgi:hypothetical protein
MTVQVRQLDPELSRDRSEFLGIQRVVYAGDPAWITPLDSDMHERLQPSRNPFCQHAELALFTATRDGRPVGRISAQVDQLHLQRYQDNTGFFGFFDTLDDLEAAGALMDAAAAWLKARNLSTMRGPMSLCFFDEMGVLLDGFQYPPMLLMPHSRSYQARLLTDLGATLVKELLAWRCDPKRPLQERAVRAHAQFVAMPEVKIRPLRKRHLAADLDVAVQMLNESFEDHWGSVPMTRPEMDKAIKGLRSIIDLDMALLAEIEGEPAAVSIALPNLNELIADMDGSLGPCNVLRLLWRMHFAKPRTWRVPILGIKPKFRRAKRYGALATALVAEIHGRSAARNIEEFELSWTLSDNARIAAIIRTVGGTVYKRYGVFERALA